MSLLGQPNTSEVNRQATITEGFEIKKPQIIKQNPKIEFSRRSALRLGVATLATAPLMPSMSQASDPLETTPNKKLDTLEECRNSPTHSISPVVGDGKWISKEPPKEPIGNYDTRKFKVTVGVEVEGTGNTTNFIATTVAPVQSPEQKIESVSIEKSGCISVLQGLSGTAGRLNVSAESINRGQRISAFANYEIELSKTFHGFSTKTLSKRSEFPTRHFASWLGNSPGIDSNSKEVNRLSKDLINGVEHPYDWAKKFQTWVFENIKGRPMKYTSVTKAIRNGVGDCEERAGTFVALCRSVGIPARLVWVPNHAWAEFCLFDNENKPVWIPAHTAAYNWFGWTGAHELVLQKGDRITLPNKGKKVRLVSDWLTWQGAKPIVRFRAAIKPVGDTTESAGPGERNKNRIGKWVLTGSHPDNKYLRA
ncbi:transglutaminase-like domain-containing protein [bacterium]|nr:transglutaminase-like domain-containing protein [bacterium]